MRPSLCFIAMCLFSAGLTAQVMNEAPAAEEWTVSLNGTWEFAPEGSTEFKPASVPGFWGRSDHSTPPADVKAMQGWKSGTYRRSFSVPEGRTGVAIDFDMVRWGGEVFVNGKAAGSIDLGYTPLRVDVSALVKPGDNVLEVRPRGWVTLPRADGKNISIPIGAGNWFGEKSAGIPDDVSLRFYDGAAIGDIRIIPTINGPACRIETAVTTPGRA